jgi:hypothetical protein
MNLKFLWFQMNLKFL